MREIKDERLFDKPGEFVPIGLRRHAGTKYRSINMFFFMESRVFEIDVLDSAGIVRTTLYETCANWEVAF